MLSIDIATFEINSEDPFKQACSNALKSRFVFPSFNKLEFFLEKYIKGIIPPKLWAIAEATAAPIIPYLNTTINRASKIIFVHPDIKVIINPSVCF